MSEGFNDWDFKLSYNDCLYISWRKNKIQKEFDFTNKILYGEYEDGLTLSSDDNRYLKNKNIPIRFKEE